MNVIDAKTIVDYSEDVKLSRENFYRCKRGEIFRYINNKLYTGMVKVGEEDSELKDNLIEVKIPKVPYELMKKMRDFFRVVYSEHNSEAVVLLWFNFDNKEWEVEVPEQDVSGAGVKYTRDEKEIESLENSNFILVGSVHSHCEMTAFHSPTDDADEYSFDGLHITIGKVGSGPEFACRFIMKEEAYKLEPKECLIWDEVIPQSPKNWLKRIQKESWNKKDIKTKTKTKKKKDKDPKKDPLDWWDDPNQYEIMDERIGPIS